MFNSATEQINIPITENTLLANASAEGNIITFTRGIGTTFEVTINTGSAGTTSGSYISGSVLIGGESGYGSLWYGSTYYLPTSASSTATNIAYYSTIAGRYAGPYEFPSGTRQAYSASYFGYEAGSRTTSTIGGQTAIGFRAGKINLGSYGTAIGIEAASGSVLLTSLARGVAIGAYAGYKGVPGSDHILIGYSSMPNLKSGNYNTAIGSVAALNFASGSQNTFIGYQAGLNLQNANNATFIGFQAGGTNSGAAYVTESVAIGYLSVVGSGSYHDVVIGSFAGGAVNTSKSVLIGYRAGYGSQSSGSVAIGTRAGEGANGSNNIFLGNLSGYGAGSVDNIFAVGTKANEPTLLADTSTGRMQVGSALYLSGQPTLTSLFEVVPDNPDKFIQFKLQGPNTPTSTAFATGSTGNIVWDNDYIYVRTSAGWKRTALSTF